VVLVFGLVACQPSVEEKAPAEKEPPTAEEKAEEPEHKEHETREGEEAAVEVSPEIAAGKALFNDVKLGTADKSCNSCHEGGKNLAGAADKYAEEGTLAKVVNSCIVDALKGQPLDKDSERMKNLEAYIHSLHE
jgi:cytochrome c